MARHVHLHFGTRDNGFKESDHPRKDNGEFGTGGKSGKSDYAKAREADFDAKRDAHHAATQKAKAARIKMLEGQLKDATPAAKKKIVKELEGLGWKDTSPKPEPKAPKAAKEPKATPYKPPADKKPPATKKKPSAGRRPAQGNANQAAQALALAKRLGKAADPDDHK